ncbi:hypothetical protein [Mycoplasmopsis mustelae]|uniref:hypothetical protein n=1 Tax=Mycoplasmopsis mustelae TaxID=171289 RepID=UPI0010669185|nr:hypothetical protein [Mycoplasmopsis mustelae]
MEKLAKKKRVLLEKSKNLSFGEIIEIDAQEEPYLKNEEKVTIYHAIDSATGYSLAIHIGK